MRKSVYTTGQIAKICNVAPRTVSKWFDSGKLKGYRIPGSNDRRVPVENLVKFLKDADMPIPHELSDERVALLVGVDDGMKQFVHATLNPEIIMLETDSLFVAGQIWAERHPKVLVLGSFLGTLSIVQIRKILYEKKDVAVLILQGEDGAPEVSDEGHGPFFRLLRTPCDPAEVVKAIVESAGAVSA